MSQINLWLAIQAIYVKDQKFAAFSNRYFKRENAWKKIRLSEKRYILDTIAGILLNIWYENYKTSIRIVYKFPSHSFSFVQEIISQTALWPGRGPGRFIADVN